MNIKQIKNNKLKTILQFSIPSIIAMLLQTVITITDGYFTENYVGDNAIKRNLYKTDSLNEGKSLPKNGSPVTFLIEKTDYDYRLLFFINRIKGKVIIDYHKTNAPACKYRIIYQTKLLWQVG